MGKFAKQRDEESAFGPSGQIEEEQDDNDEIIPRPRAIYGSFYLRLGALIFGCGSMIYAGIEVGVFFEVSLDGDTTCKQGFSIIRPFLQMVFVFVQMYFIFLNQKMNIYKNKFWSRLGLMHMIATNLSIWINVLIMETSHDFHMAQVDDHPNGSHTGGIQHVTENINHTNLTEHGMDHRGIVPNVDDHDELLEHINVDDDDDEHVDELENHPKRHHRKSNKPGHHSEEPDVHQPVHQDKEHHQDPPNHSLDDTHLDDEITIYDLYDHEIVTTLPGQHSLEEHQENHPDDHQNVRHSHNKSKEEHALPELLPLIKVHHDDGRVMTDQDLNKMVGRCLRRNYIMKTLLTDSGPFLFPCTIEYSLICAAVLFVMWKNIVEEHEHYKIQRRKRKISIKMRLVNTGANNNVKTYHHYSVDCSQANTGLFTGIFVMVGTIISLIVFFVLINSENDELVQAAITTASLTELVLYGLSTCAVIIGTFQMRVLCFDKTRNLHLDNLLLIVAQTGVFIYAAFSIIGAFFQLQSHLLAFLAAVATLGQTLLQTIFILDASNRFAYTPDQVKKKPGREVVTFLLVCNLAMWAINTLETNRADSHPIQVKFYGGEWVWPIITHVSMPLAIFYRFHSTVCLCEIWTKSFKYRSWFVPDE